MSLSEYSVESLLREIESKDQRIKDLEAANSKAESSIQKFYTQQKSLFDEFVLLRGKYDKTKLSVLDMLWKNCAPYHPDLKNIPSIFDHQIIETNECIGSYFLDKVIGEGQFAVVKTGYRNLNDKGERIDECAIKIINKEKINTLQSLKRLSAEIDILWYLHRSIYIIDIFDVVQSDSKLYLITEKGPSDLFDFFNKYSSGISEDGAKYIIAEIFKAIFYCHARGVSHRDLKPENILLDFDIENKKVNSLKLCDFGLATYCDDSTILTDFCGSPGFFSPEMLIKKEYIGFEVDLFSVGCIILNMLTGHKKFESIWMTAYDYENLKNVNVFEQEILDKQTKLTNYLPFSDDLNYMVLNLLSIDPAKRINKNDIIKHTYFDGWMQFDDETNIKSNLRISTTHNVHFIENPVKSTHSNKNTIEDSLPSINHPKTPNSNDMRKFLHDHNESEFIQLPKLNS